MNILFTSQGWQDYLYWQANGKAVLKRINTLVRDVQRSPFDGIGQPEPLRFSLTGNWSRRIDQEHRLVYRYADGTITILQCRYHY